MNPAKVQLTRFEGNETSMSSLAFCKQAVSASICIFFMHKLVDSL